MNLNLIDILVIVGCVLLGIYVIVSSIKNKKKGKTGCGCNCSSCSGCAYKKTKTDKNK